MQEQQGKNVDGIRIETHITMDRTFVYVQSEREREKKEHIVVSHLHKSFRS